MPRQEHVAIVLHKTMADALEGGLISWSALQKETAGPNLKREHHQQGEEQAACYERRKIGGEQLCSIRHCVPQGRVVVDQNAVGHKLTRGLLKLKVEQVPGEQSQQNADPDERPVIAQKCILARLFEPGAVPDRLHRIPPCHSLDLLPFSNSL